MGPPSHGCQPLLCISFEGGPEGGTSSSWGLQGRDALEGKGPQRRPQKRLDRQLEKVVKAVGAVAVGYKCH